MRLLLEPASTRTICGYCGVGCGLVASPRPQRLAEIAGDERHPGTLGRLCVKGATLAHTLSHRARLECPRLHGRNASWDEALSFAAEELTRIRRVHGPESIAFYLSGQLLTEDYYVANKLAKGFIGTSHVDTNSRLCMSSSVAAYTRALGGDLVPTQYADLDEAELVVWAGSNAAICHPVLFERAQAAQRKGTTRMVCIDPRRTETAAQCDLHLALRPGTDAVLWVGLLASLVRADAIDHAFVRAHCAGFEGARDNAEAYRDPGRVADECGLALDEVERFYALFASTRRVVTAHSQGVHQSQSGTDKVNAILDAHLARGAIGIVGAGPLSLTGQVNAMGGREVGGLSTTLAAHMAFTPDNVERVGRFWRAPSMASSPGLTAVEIFQAMERGEIKALVVACTNPLASLPDAHAAARALAKCELVVVSEIYEETETAAAAHVLLPALGWGEKDGTVTSSERRIARQRAFSRGPTHARADWWIFAELGRRLGHGAAFEYQSARDVFVEHAALSAFENKGSRVFDLGGLAHLDQDAYETLEPIQWPVRVRGVGTPRLFLDHRFATPDGLARFIGPTPRGPVEPTSVERPLALITGRLREHWHTMTRTERVPALREGASEPRIEVHPIDAAAREISDGQLVRIESARGAMVGRARVTATTQRGALFAPIHWRAANAPSSRVGPVMGAFLDPHSKQPETKHAAVTLRALPVAWEGVVAVRAGAARTGPLTLEGLVHWVRVLGEDASRYHVAGVEAPPSLESWSDALVSPVLADDIDWVELRDDKRGSFRAACFEGESLLACVFVESIASRLELPAGERLLALFDGRAYQPRARYATLLGARPT